MLIKKHSVLSFASPLCLQDEAEADESDTAEVDADEADDCDIGDADEADEAEGELEEEEQAEFEAEQVHECTDAVEETTNETEPEIKQTGNEGEQQSEHEEPPAVRESLEEPLPSERCPQTEAIEPVDVEGLRDQVGERAEPVPVEEIHDSLEMLDDDVLVEASNGSTGHEDCPSAVLEQVEDDKHREPSEAEGEKHAAVETPNVHTVARPSQSLRKGWMFDMSVGPHGFYDVHEYGALSKCFKE